MNFDIVNLSINITRKRILKRKATDISKKMKNIRKFVTENMKNVEERQLSVVNVHRKNVKYEVENLM